MIVHVSLTFTLLHGYPIVVVVWFSFSKPRHVLMHRILHATREIAEIGFHVSELLKKHVGSALKLLQVPPRLRCNDF